LAAVGCGHDVGGVDTIWCRIIRVLVAPDGMPKQHEVGAGEGISTGHAAAMPGFSPQEGKAILAGLQRHLIAAPDLLPARGGVPAQGPAAPVADFAV
jgi:hypothetical protein